VIAVLYHRSIHILRIRSDFASSPDYWCHCVRVAVDMDIHGYIHGYVYDDGADGYEVGVLDEDLAE